MILSTGIAEEVYGCGKEANLTTVFSLSSHPVLICLSTFAQNTHKIYHMKDHTVAVTVSVNKLSL